MSTLAGTSDGSPPLYGGSSCESDINRSSSSTGCRFDPCPLTTVAQALFADKKS